MTDDDNDDDDALAGAIEAYAEAYRARQVAIAARERAAATAFAVALDAVAGCVHDLLAQGVPASFHHTATELWLDVGTPPNASGRFSVALTGDHRVAIARRRHRGDADDEVERPAPRAPEDLVAAAWRDELRGFLAWLVADPAAP